jgi:hypothetical protein
LEGYVFFAVLYGESKKLVKGRLDFGRNQDFPSPELVAIFPNIGWKAVAGHPLSGLADLEPL